MENASKALYIAAGVLIGIMVLSVFVYLFRAGGKMGTNYEQKQEEEQLRLFNSKFEEFARDNNTISDIISVTNLAIDNNEKNYYNSSKTVLITFNVANYEFYIKTTEPMKRNYIFFRGVSTEKKVYLYDLMGESKDVLKKRYNLDFRNTLESGETLSIVDKNMNYRYLFKCKEIKYREENGRVEKMDFIVVENEKYEQ